MRLPLAVLARLRAPALAAVLAGCADPAVSTVTPEPTPAPDSRVAVVDPVSYDPATESERYARLDQTDARDQQTREARLADEASDDGIGSSFGLLGGWAGQRVHPGCGRG